MRGSSPSDSRTEHHELMIEPRALELIPRIVRHYGEPFADDSAIPSFYVAEMARRHVTVALNGDGGDESFAGYSAVCRKPRRRTAGADPAALPPHAGGGRSAPS